MKLGTYLKPVPLFIASNGVPYLQLASRIVQQHVIERERERERGENKKKICGKLHLLVRYIFV